MTFEASNTRDSSLKEYLDTLIKGASFRDREGQEYTIADYAIRGGAIIFEAHYNDRHTSHRRLNDCLDDILVQVPIGLRDETLPDYLMAKAQEESLYLLTPLPEFVEEEYLLTPPPESKSQQTSPDKYSSPEPGDYDPTH